MALLHREWARLVSVDVPAVSEQNVSSGLFSIRINGEMTLAPRYFYADSDVNDHADKTELDCAREVARYIDAHGLSSWLFEWNLDDIDVYVGNYPAVLKGITITADEA